LNLRIYKNGKSPLVVIRPGSDYTSSHAGIEILLSSKGKSFKVRWLFTAYALNAMSSTSSPTPQVSPAVQHPKYSIMNLYTTPCEDPCLSTLQRPQACDACYCPNNFRHTSSLPSSPPSSTPSLSRRGSGIDDSQYHNYIDSYIVISDREHDLRDR
jgi:hypothetical protein